MANQPTTNSAYTYVAAAGTTVVRDSNVNLQRVILQGTYIGSVEFYDAATAAGTAATNEIYKVGLPLTNALKSIDLGLRTRNGLVVVATGTPTLTYTYD